MMEFNSKIFVAGHAGMVGSAICRALQRNGFDNLLTVDFSELDLRNQQAVNDFVQKHQPDYMIVAAAKVGGILANNTYKAEFLYDNLMIELNLIHAAHLNKVKKLLFLGSSCIYPRLAPQPIKEEYLLEGALEPTNEGYALAKICGIKLCDTYRHQYGCNFISAMPTNLYGYGDNYHPENSHVLPALIRRFHEAKINNTPEVVVWGSGSPLREFMFADDVADACVYLMQNHNEPGWVNVGTGEEISIKELAQLLKDTVGYTGTLRFDTTKPDGTPRKLLDVSKLNALGFKAKTTLKEGLKAVYEDYLKRGQEQG